MNDDVRPDREGYLDFKLAVENGDMMLQHRAALDWRLDPVNLRTPHAWYFDLFCAETSAREDRMSKIRQENIIHDAAQRVGRIDNSDVRLATAARIKERIEAWNYERFQSGRAHLKTCGWRIREHVAERQTANPRERESESWFWAKFRTEQHFLGYLIEIECDLKGEINKIIEASWRQDGLDMTGETGSPSLAHTRVSRRDPDCDRER